MNGLFPYRAEFHLSGDERGLRAAFHSLLPESGESGRTRVEVKLKDGVLFLVIFAADAVALRAGINSYLRWLNEALEVYERTENGVVKPTKRV